MQFYIWNQTRQCRPPEANANHAGPICIWMPVQKVPRQFKTKHRNVSIIIAILASWLADIPHYTLQQANTAAGKHQSTVHIGRTWQAAHYFQQKTKLVLANNKSSWNEGIPTWNEGIPTWNEGIPTWWLQTKRWMWHNVHVRPQSCWDLKH